MSENKLVIIIIEEKYVFIKYLRGSDLFFENL
jgi:hypothetical protein